MSSAGKGGGSAGAAASVTACDRACLIRGAMAYISTIGKRRPFDLPAAHNFKVGADGQVHEIEAMGFVAPYKSPSGGDD